MIFGVQVWGDRPIPLKIRGEMTWSLLGGLMDAQYRYLIVNQESCMVVCQIQGCKVMRCHHLLPFLFLSFSLFVLTPNRNPRRFSSLEAFQGGFRFQGGQKHPIFLIGFSVLRVHEVLDLLGCNRRVSGLIRPKVNGFWTQSVKLFLPSSPLEVLTDIFTSDYLRNSLFGVCVNNKHVLRCSSRNSNLKQ